ncbi:hypothetical protein AMJ86_06850 [bacterium SM23_57]|nr:MAG: hypothetical protein AMJ86_06850 [bacterium SM23_57]
MVQREFHLHNGKRGAALSVRVVSNSRVDEIADILQDGTLYIRLTSSAVEKEINKSLTNFLSNVLQVPKTKIEIVAGVSGSDKLVSILDMEAELAHQIILDYIT